MNLSTNEIKPDKNGRWPVQFLQNQLVRLVVALSNCEQWQKNSGDNLREPENSITTGGVTDQAAIEMRRWVGSLESECCEDKTRAVRVAMLNVVHDIERSTSAGRYGRCIDCETTIPAFRLEASPWAQRCFECQTIKEASPQGGGGGHRTMKVRPSEARPPVSKIYKAGKTNTRRRC